MLVLCIHGEAIVVTEHMEFLDRRAQRVDRIVTSLMLLRVVKSLFGMHLTDISMTQLGYSLVIPSYLCSEVLTFLKL
jgi:hypothetical protein